MVDPNRVAVVYSIQNLKKGLLDQVVITNIIPTLRDTREQVALGTVLQHNKCAIFRVHDLDQGNHIGMLAGLMVELNLTLLKSPLSWVQTNLVQGLDSIGMVIVVDVDGCVDDPIRAHAYYTGKLQAPSQDLAQSIGLSTCSRWFW